MSKSANSIWRTVCRPLWKFFAATILSKSAARQRRAGLAVPRHVRDDVPFPAEVLHELRGELHRVPLDAGQARHPELVHAREQLVQAVAELVEERDHLVVREERRPPPDGGGEVAGEEGHRRLHARGEAPAVARIVHPGAAALGLARIQVEVELAHQAPRRVLDREELHVRVPGLGRRRLHAHAVERLDHAEEAAEHGVLREIALHLVVGEGVALLAELLARPRHVPGPHVGEIELGAGELRELGHVALRERLGPRGEVLQEGDDFRRRPRHLRGERDARRRSRSRGARRPPRASPGSWR